MNSTGFITVGQASKRVGVTRQRIHQMIAEKQINGVIWMLERWAIPDAEIKRVCKERQAKPPNGNGKK